MKMEEENLKQNILAVISGLLCDESELRNVAEDRRKALEFKPEYPIQLAEILHDTKEPVEERQMCALMLKEYINQYWEFNTSFCTNDVKATTRTLISHALGDPNVKILDSAAYLLGMIAQLDYPHTWKEMLSMLNDKLRSQDQRIVIGGVTFMQECFQKIPRLLHENLINQPMYDFFYGITEQEQIYSTPLRSKVIELVTNLIIQDFSRDKDIARVGPIANRFTAIMGYILNQQYGASSDFQIKATIVSSYTKFLCCIPEMVGQLVISTLPIIWDILIACADEYRQIIAVRSNSNALLQHRILPLDSTEESGYPINFMTLVDNIFTMINYAAVTKEPFASVDVDLYMGEKNLTDIFHSILIFLCATPYTERDILNSDLEYLDDDLIDDDAPISYVSLSTARFSRSGLRHLLLTVIRSSTSVVKPLACVRLAILRALEYMQSRRLTPLPPEVIKLKFLEEECTVATTMATSKAIIANRASQAGGIAVVPPQGPVVPEPIFTPLPGGYDLYSTRVAEGIMYILCSISSFVGSPQESFSAMISSALPFPPPEVPQLQDNTRAGPSGIMGLSSNIDHLMFGFTTRMKADKMPRLSNIEFTIREFLNKFQEIAQPDDLLLNSRIALAAAHYGWVFSIDEYKYHLSKISVHLVSQFEICRHAAVRALRIHCNYFKGETQPQGFLNVQLRMQLTDQFVRFIPEFNNNLLRIWPYASIDMLNVIVSNITHLVTMNNHASRLMVDFIMASLAKHMVHSTFVKEIKVLIEALMISVRNKNYFQLHLLQRVLDILRTANAPAPTVLVDTPPLTTIAIGLDLFSEVLRLADGSNLQFEVISPSIRIVYVALMGVIDVKIARNGQRCLSMYFLRFGEQVLLLRNIMACDAYMNLFNHLMDLSQSEELCIGLEHPFLSMLIIFHEEFQLYLDKFVKSLLSRLNHAQSLDVRDSLIMMFLGLFYYHSEPTMRLLDMLPGPDGTTSALIFIVPLLLDVHYNSCYTQNLYVHVVTSIMQQSLLLDDRRFLDLHVEHNYFTQKGIVHNRHVVQPIFTNSQLMDQTISNGHATGSTATTLDSDIAVPPSYRGDALHPVRPLQPAVFQSRVNNRAAGTSERSSQPVTSRASLASSNSGTRDMPSTSAGPSTSGVASAEVESMDLSYSSSAANFPVPSIVPPLDLQSLMNALSATEGTVEAVSLLEEVSVTATVPFLRKSFRMLLDVMLVNRRDHPERGEMILSEIMVFPEAEPNMDIRRYQPLTTLASMELVPFIQSFFYNLVDGNFLELFQLCHGLNPHHRNEVDRMLQAHDADLLIL